MDAPEKIGPSERPAPAFDHRNPIRVIVLPKTALPSSKYSGPALLRAALKPILSNL
jgi:hypothetical protein